MTKTPNVEEQLERVYDERFSDSEAARKDALWKEVARFLQRFVTPDATVLDLGCDRGDFIRNIEAAEKWACDLRDVSIYLPNTVRFVQCDGLAVADSASARPLRRSFHEQLPGAPAIGGRGA